MTFHFIRLANSSGFFVSTHLLYEEILRTCYVGWEPLVQRDAGAVLKVFARDLREAIFHTRSEKTKTFPDRKGDLSPRQSGDDAARERGSEAGRRAGGHGRAR